MYKFTLQYVFYIADSCSLAAYVMQKIFKQSGLLIDIVWFQFNTKKLYTWINNAVDFIS